MPVKGRDPYSTFARAYDAWQAGFSRPFSEAILPYYEQAIARNGVPEESIADIACGTGIFLRAWRGRHPEWRLIGTDGSPEMLRIARQKRIGARLLLMRIERTALPRPVGVAVSMFDSINHITRPRDLARGLSAISRSLLPGGLFIFDLNDEYAFPRLFSGSWTIESGDFFVSVTASSVGDLGTSRFTVFERDATSRRAGWRRSDFAVTERNWHTQEIVEMVRAAGLLLIRTRRIRPYPVNEADTPRTLWICRKPGSPARPRSNPTTASGGLARGSSSSALGAR
jgi:SAM-dependent methyltransferase